jgi:transcriptional regulator GlxA family with amidase domain
MARNSVFKALKRFLHHQARKPPLSASDGEFLGRFREIVAQHHSDGGFTTQVAAASVSMSRMHLNRKLQALTGQSTHEFIRTMRLEAARNLLPMPLSVESIAEAVGFKSSSHFAKVFKERFGVRPSTYRAMKALAREPPRMKSPGE